MLVTFIPKTDIRKKKYSNIEMPLVIIIQHLYTTVGLLPQYMKMVNQFSFFFRFHHC